MARKKQAQKKLQKQQGTALAIVAQKPSAPRSDADEEPFPLALRPAGSASKGVAKSKKKVKKADRFQNRPRYTAQERKEMAEDAKARREEQERDDADADYDPAEGEEQEALDRAADEEDPAYEEEIVPDDVDDMALLPAARKRKERAPRPSQIEQHKIKEREALACTEITTCKDQEKGDDGRPRETEKVLTYPKWVDSTKAIQNVTFGKLCLERGWDNSSYNNIKHIKKENKQWYLRRWYTENPEQLHVPVTPPTDEEIAEREDRAADAVDRRAAKAARTKANSAALVTSTHVVGVPPAVHEAMLAQQKATEETATALQAEVERLKAKAETAENDAKQSRAQLSNLRQAGQADVRRMTQAVQQACGAEVLQKVNAAHQALLDAEAKAATPWDEAMAHAKRVNDQAVATAEAGEALKAKIVAALSARHSQQGNHALVCAETSIGFLKTALKGFPNLLTAIEEGAKKDAALIKKEAKEQQAAAARVAAAQAAQAAQKRQQAAVVAAASDPTRRAIENAQIDDLEAMENAAAAEGAFTFQGSLPLEA